MREAVIVSYARTGLAKSGRGGFNITPPMSLAAHAIKHAVARAGLYNYNPLFTIPEYIAHAGGPSRTARDVDDVKLIDRDGHTHPYKNGLKPGPGETYTAVQVKTNVGPKIVLLQHSKSGGWWSRIYDAN